jgi:hypothetical protein
MAKTDLVSLNEYLFAQLDALSNPDLTGEELEQEIERSRAIQGIAKTVIDGANVALQAQKHMDEYGSGRNVSIPLLGMSDANLEEENKNLRKRLKKTEAW